ncbi:MAG TPA: hypothetical protein VIG46_10845 [Candidatus Baltobacteraceae bacterium]|jgi:hypothetical protein
MNRTLLAAVALAAFTTAAALADGSPGMMPNYPIGVTVYATATATTTDVNGTFTANKTAKTAAQAATVLAAAKAAAGAAATVDDLGLSTQVMGGSVEGVRITSTPSDARAIRAKLETAGFTAEAVTNVAKDPTALHAEALAKATKVARAQAEAAASADGRHAGRLLNIAPSPMAMIGDLTAAFGNVPQVQMIMGGGSSAPTATSFASGYYTFELAP